MKKATKEKRVLNNRRKVNNKSIKTHGIFDYEQEIKKTQPKNKKLTRKAKSKINDSEKNSKLAQKKLKENKKKIQNIKKRKKEEKAKQIKEIKTRQKIENKIQNRKAQPRLTLKQIKQKKRNKKIIRNSLIALIILSAILLLILSPIFYIKEIKVIGNEKVPTQQVISLLKIGNQTNIFKESERDLKNKLKENAYIDTEKTTIRKKLPDTLEVNIKERTIEFLFEFGSSYAYIDKKGYILEISSASVEGKIKVLGYQTSQEDIKAGNKLCDSDLLKLNDIIKIQNIAKNFDLSEKITSVNISDSDDYLIYMESENKTVHLGNANNIDTKMLFIKAILEKEKGNDGEIFVNIDLNKKNAYFKQNV